MDKDQILNTLTEIGTCEDEAQRRTMLDGLRDEISGVYDNMDSLTQRNSALTTANENLRKANMDLFVQVGTHKKPEDQQDTDPEPVRRKFEDLFNDKGEIK